MSRLNLGAITAYAIAKKHGFEGTEEEWLASLKCDSGTQVTVGGVAQETWNADTKVDVNATKQTGAFIDAVYARRTDGTVVRQAIAQQPRARLIPCYNDRKTLQTDTPTEAKDCINKEYLEANSGGKYYEHRLEFSFFPQEIISDDSSGLEGNIYLVFTKTSKTNTPLVDSSEYANDTLISLLNGTNQDGWEFSQSKSYTEYSHITGTYKQCNIISVANPFAKNPEFFEVFLTGTTGDIVRAKNSYDMLAMTRAETIIEL